MPVPRRLRAFSIQIFTKLPCPILRAAFCAKGGRTQMPAGDVNNYAENALGLSASLCVCTDLKPRPERPPLICRPLTCFPSTPSCYAYSKQPVPLLYSLRRYQSHLVDSLLFHKLSIPRLIRDWLKKPGEPGCVPAPSSTLICSLNPYPLFPVPYSLFSSSSPPAENNF